MRPNPKFYVWWIGERHGIRKWHVRDTGTRKIVSKPFASERAAVLMCDRMQADWDRYQSALWERRASCLRQG